MISIRSISFPIHVQSMDALKQGLTEIGVNYTELRFRSDEGIDSINTNIFVSCLITIWNISIITQPTTFNYGF